MKMTRRRFIQAGLFSVIGAAGGWGYFQHRSPVLERIDIKLDRLPAVFSGLKAAVISDVHSGPLVGRSLIESGVALALAAEPDLVFLTGDFISAATKMVFGLKFGGYKDEYLDRLLVELEKLKPPLGAYAVLGNHDFWSGRKTALKVVQGLSDIGVRVLQNDFVRLERESRSLVLAGVDDYWERSYHLPKALKGIGPEECVILLSHNPDVNEDVEAQGYEVDLIVSGHTHGGQIVLPGLGSPYLPSSFGQKYRAGLVRDGKRQTYVNRGLGVFFVPIRLGCPPEVTLIRFASA